MSKRKTAKQLDSSSEEDQTSSDDDDYCTIPQSDNSDVEGCTDDENSDEEEILSMKMPYKMSYSTVAQSYTSKQKKLEENHVYSWVEGEKNMIFQF